MNDQQAGFPDIHTHILPEMDDGSKDVLEALHLLRLCMEQNTPLVALTPHFYAWQNNPDAFLLRREASICQLLTSACGEALPHMILGAEVAYFSGISRCAELDKLCYAGTDLLLLEMPFSEWTDRIFTELRDIRGRLGIRIIIAHIDRYLRIQSNTVIERLFECDLMFQANASFFCNRRTSGKAVEMLHSDRLHFIGSDCHNSTDRAPDMKPAYSRITKLMPENELSSWRNKMFSLLEGAKTIM